MSEPDLKCRRGHTYVWCVECGDGACLCVETPAVLEANQCAHCAGWDHWQEADDA